MPAAHVGVTKKRKFVSAITRGAARSSGAVGGAMKTIDCNTHYWPIEFLDRTRQDRILGGNAAELFGLEVMAPA